MGNNTDVDAKAREIVAAASIDCSCRIPFPYDEVAEFAVAMALTSETLQERVQPWMLACFGEVIAGDREERNHRFLEEALELVQACGCTASEAHQLVDYVFGREIGEPPQEVGGVMVTLAALCLANGIDMHAAAETELARIWTKVEAIRAKQAAKPKHSPLPEHASADKPDVIYVHWSDDGQCIRRWSREPFISAEQLQAVSQVDLTRPIISMEHRTAQEVFDIMVDRVRQAATCKENLQVQPGEDEQ